MGNGLLLTDISSHLQVEFPQICTDAVGRKDHMLGLFNQPKVAGGAGPEFRVNYSGNSSAGSYADGDPEPVAGKQSYVKGSLNWKYSWVVLRVSRRAIDSAGANYSLIGDLIQSEQTRGVADLKNDLNTQAMGDATDANDIDGIATMVKATGYYAGLNRSSYTWWQSYIDSSTTTLSTTALRTAMRTLRDTPRLAKTSLGICGPTVWAIASALIQGTAPTYYTMSSEAGQGGLKGELGLKYIFIEGVPLVEIPGYTAQRIDLLDTSVIDWKIIRDFTVDEPVLSGDDWTWKVTFGSNLECRHSGKQGALTTISA